MLPTWWPKGQKIDIELPLTQHSYLLQHILKRSKIDIELITSHNMPIYTVLYPNWEMVIDTKIQFSSTEDCFVPNAMYYIYIQICKCMHLL